MFDLCILISGLVSVLELMFDQCQKVILVEVIRIFRRQKFRTFATDEIAEILVFVRCSDDCAFANDMRDLLGFCVDSLLELQQVEWLLNLLAFERDC